MKIKYVIFCKTCNLFLCEECLNQHKENNESHEFIELNKLKINFCYFHNKNSNKFCFDCNEEICEECVKEHNKHKIEKIIIDNKNLENFKNFLENAEISKKNKYMFLKEIIIKLENLNKNESKKELNNIIEKMIEIFYNDLKIAQNLIFFAKILFISCEKIKVFSDIRKKQFDTLIKIINKYFENENFENFQNIINNEKYKFLNYFAKISKDKKFFDRRIKELFSQSKGNKNFYFFSDFEKTKNFINSSFDYSGFLKKEIAIDKIDNPYNYINIDKTLNNIENIYKNISSNESEFILSLIAKYLEKNGAKLNILKKNEKKKLKNIDLISMQYNLFTLVNQKKYELIFDFGEEKIKEIMTSLNPIRTFKKEYKKIIAEKLEVEKKNIIFSDIQEGSLRVHLKIRNNNKKDSEIIDRLKGIENLKKVNIKPLLEELRVSPEILDPKGDRNSGWGKNEKRGGEKYIPPSKDWYGIGLNVYGQYDNGNNDWLDCTNKKDEYPVAYLGLNNFLNDKEKIIEDLNDFCKDVNKMIKEKTYQEEENTRKKNRKCGEGICLFPNPEHAENSAGIIDLLGYRYKIIIMCRVKKNKIRQPKNFPYCWILNPAPDEIRPYRILIKKFPISPMTGAANDTIITTTTPIDYIISSINSNDFSFYNLKNDIRYRMYSILNEQKLNPNDFFVLKLYSSDYYKYINNYLRFKEINKFTEKEIKSWICCLQLALKNNINVKDNTIVYRGVEKYKFPSEIGVGSKFYFREFISTSTSISIAKEFTENSKQGTIMGITIKNNGTNGRPNYCFYIAGISKFPREKEILFSSHCLSSPDPVINVTVLDHAVRPVPGHDDVVKHQDAYAVQQPLQLERGGNILR